MLRTAPLPTAAELMILRVLWRRGPSTVRQVQEVLEQDRPTGYTTALKLLQIMHAKGLVQRDESARSHVYRARASEVQTLRQLVRDLADRAFDGSTTQLIVHALAVKPPTRAEAAELRKHIQPAADAPPREPATPAAASPHESGAPAADAAPDEGRLF
jgi:BlaI family transcriptional regulator, penicillinase repressor